jgi:hypothetical protein
MALLKDGTRIYGNATVDGTLTTSNITLTSGIDTSYVLHLPDSSGDGNGYSTLQLIPDGNLIASDQYLIVDPTAPGHIHIRAGGTQDSSSAALILGGEYSNFVVQNGTNPPVAISSNSHVWTFGTDGNLTLPSGGTINWYDGSNALTGGTAFNPTTLVQSVNITAAGTQGGGGEYAVTYSATSYTASVLSTGIVVQCQGITQYTSGSAAVGSQTVTGTFGDPHANQPYTVYAHITTDAGIIWSAQATGTTGLCLIAGTEITLANGRTKRIEDIGYGDVIRVWDFDTAGFGTARPLWIKRVETALAYNELIFSDGSTLRTVDQHRIFNKQAGAFTYPMTDHTPLGTVTYTVEGTEVTLVSKRVVTEIVDYYNVITDRHMNVFANGILTSCRFSNAYPIVDMRWIKHGRQLRDRAEFAGIADRWIDGLRLCEQTYAVEDCRWYVARLERLEMAQLALAA